MKLSCQISYSAKSSSGKEEMKVSSMGKCGMLSATAPSTAAACLASFDRFSPSEPVDTDGVLTIALEPLAAEPCSSESAVINCCG